MRRWLAGTVALTLSLPTLAADEAVDWVVKMSEAARSSTYQGTVVYRGSDALETFRVAHREIDGQEQERVQSLNGAPRDILKQGNQVICLLPRDRRMTASRPPTPNGIFPKLTADRIKLMTQIYQLSNLGEARIAGRNCKGVAVTPRDDYRYGYEMWADSQTAVPLKVNLIGRNGAVLEQMMFTEVDFPTTIADTAFDMPKPDQNRELVSRTLPTPATAEAATATASTPVTAQPMNPGWVLSQLPPGFKIVTRELRALPGNRGTVEHLVISDGISAISVFSSQQSAPPPPPRPMSQIGAMRAYGRIVGSTRVTVVGEAPEATIRMIGDGVKPANDPSDAAASAVDAAKP